MKELVVVEVLLVVQLAVEAEPVQPLQEVVLRVLQTLEAVVVPEVLLEVKVLQVVLVDLE